MRRPPAVSTTTSNDDSCSDWMAGRTSSQMTSLAPWARHQAAPSIIVGAHVAVSQRSRAGRRWMASWRARRPTPSCALRMSTLDALGRSAHNARIVCSAGTPAHGRSATCSTDSCGLIGAWVSRWRLTTTSSASAPLFRRSCRPNTASPGRKRVPTSDPTSSTTPANDRPGTKLPCQPGAHRTPTHPKPSPRWTSARVRARSQRSTAQA